MSAGPPSQSVEAYLDNNAVGYLWGPITERPVERLAQARARLAEQVGKGSLLVLASPTVIGDLAGLAAKDRSTCSSAARFLRELAGSR